MLIEGITLAQGERLSSLDQGIPEVLAIALEEVG
jgi:hypothetical protein